MPHPEGGRATLEICVDTPASLFIAARAGADRIELCAALDLGGLTPSDGMMRAAASLPVPIMVMIRPRAGGFDYSDQDLSMMIDDINRARDHGLTGVVLGATRKQELDMDALARLVRAADGMEITLHRAVDCVADPVSAVDAAVDLSIARILSAGGASRAIDGIDVLRRMASHAAGRTEIIAGGGVTPQQIPIFAAAGLKSFHASARSLVSKTRDFGSHREANELKIRGLRSAMDLSTR